jgi:hypothetical protein
MKDYKKILELLPSYGYDGNNLIIAQEKIRNQFIDETYRAVIDEDGRFIKKIESADRELLDNGWKLFCHCFNDFVNRNKITYDNFISNSFYIGKQKRKLFKACNDFYGEDISDEIERISAISLPKKEELYIVLSVNFNDFILCSTGNPWTSCLDLKSGQYSNSLSGFLFDRNRAMIYITDKTKKEFNGIESYVMFSRMWCLLDKSNTININISYPTRESISENLLSQVTGMPLKNIDNSFISKYEVDKLDNKNDVFVFGYQDFTKFKSVNDLHLIFSKCTGCYSIINTFDGKKEIVNFDDIYQLKSHGESLDKLLLTECSICGHKTSKVSFINGDGICKSCFDKEQLICCECGHSYKRKFITVDNEIVCTNCKNKNGYIKCKKCHRYFESYGDDIYEECYSKTNSKCDICHNIVQEYELIDLSKTMFMTIKKIFKPFNNRGKVCNDCIETFCEEQNIIFCENCGEYYESNKEKKCPICGEQTE